MTKTLPSLYSSYSSYKAYSTPEVGRKQIRQFDKMVWEPGACTNSMNFLEIGCGTGAFLSYLATKGCQNILGIDQDQSLAAVLPRNVQERFLCADAWTVLSTTKPESIDRVIALDVLEHFRAEDAVRLLVAIKSCLSEDGRIIVKVPNASSLWGLQYQFGDLTHCTGYTQGSLHQLAKAAGLKCLMVLPQRLGTRRRVITDTIVHRFLSWAMLNPPEIWSANIVAVFAK